MSKQHKILLIATGGTIAGEVAADKRDEQDIRTADDFSELVKPGIAALMKKWKVDVDIDPEDLKDAGGNPVKVDSSNILPEHWKRLAALIKERYDDYDSFIITHGTNTMGYTCAALSFAIANSNKPIIVTGSQVPSGMIGTDALTNLNNAMRVAVWPRDQFNAKNIRGVVAVFGSHIITGTRVKKDTEFDYDAFKSFTVGSIGRIGRIIHINESNLEKHLSYIHTPQLHGAIKGENLKCVNDFEMNIASLTEFPGMSHEIFKTLVDQNDIKGFILRSFGAGDASTFLIPAFEFLKNREIPIVVTTQAPNGNSNFQVNEPGQFLKDNKLAIPAYDMSIESQTTKLGWLLAKKNKKEITYEQLCDQMTIDIRGEVNPFEELDA